MNGWIVIPGWDKHQHYSNRDPVWIKVYTDLNSRDEWWTLSWSRRGIYLTVIIEYARSRGRLRCDQVQALCKTWLRPGDLEALNHAGFIEIVASAPARFSASPRALAREEKRREEAPLPPQDVGEDFFEPPTPIRGTRAAGTNPRAVKAKAAKNDQQQVHDRLLEAARDIAANWNGGSSDIFDDQLDALERNYRDKLGYLERDELWTDALNRPGKPADPDDELF